MTSMDVSIDEFHNTVPAVARIIQEIVSSEHLVRCVRVSISGLDTLKSYAQFNYLIAYLKAHDIHVFPLDNEDVATLNYYYKSPVNG